ncbi:hypothetical protein [Bdellovibrio sp. KM01]|uniref:hypothetical protein n=1 Tax=Bdellovibrio sp. KM01 TaxID=2748865 RepID=UPI0015EB0600|nr:hypothetical protein [Bdellovibrio sp. KM01]QLY24666.1 hypothetical protein HW988_14570 [Bdellovibrio sp. KM01]
MLKIGILLTLLSTLVGHLALAGSSDIQYQSAFLSPAMALSSPYKKIDLTKLINKASSLPADPELRIQTVLVAQARFQVPRSIAELKASALNNIRTLPNISSSLKLWACIENTCQGEMDMALASVQFVMSYAMLDLQQSQNATWATAKLPAELLQGTQLITVQEVSDWSHLFTDSFSINIFQAVDSGSTVITNFQIHLVKASAYQKAKYIPFFNLEKNLNSHIQKQLQEIQQALSTGKRSPSSANNEPNLYQQSSYKLIDPEGDRALIERANSVPKHILESLINKEGPQDKNWLPDPREWEDPLADLIPQPEPTQGISIQGRENPLYLESFKKTLTQVIQEESRRGLPPLFGIAHEWSAAYKNKHVMSQGSKLLVALALGFTDRFMITGKEENLRQWILTENYESITLPELFRASYRINHGDVYLTLLTIENVLANNWRFVGRESLPITKRLRPISSGHNYKGDRYGTWYHFFGMILYGYVHGGTQAKAIGKIEALGSNMLSPNLNQTQKQWFNILGGYVGAHLKNVIREKSYKTFVGSKTFLQESYYLNRREDFRDRLPQELSADIQAGLFRPRDNSGLLTSIQIVNHSPRSCQVDLIFDKGKGFDSRYKAVQMEVDFSSLRPTFIRASAPFARAVRGFIHNCENTAKEWIFEASL